MEQLANASWFGDFAVLKELLNNGADISAEYGYMALRYASARGHFEIVKLLLDRGVIAHANTNEALRCASSYGRLEIVKLLLDRGADIHVLLDMPILNAADNGHTAVVLELLNRGANSFACRTRYAHTRELLDNYLIWKKYYGRWRRFSVSRWAERLLQVWFRPDVRGGINAKKHMLQF